jgi:hypothetical protein
MMKTAVVLAMLPLAVFAPGFTPPVRTPATVAVTPVATEGVRRVALDTRTFNARWIPVRDMPHAIPAALVYRREPEQTEQLPVPTPRPYIRALPTPVRDLCTRHKLRKVWVTNKKWRCKR